MQSWPVWSNLAKTQRRSKFVNTLPFIDSQRTKFLSCFNYLKKSKWNEKVTWKWEEKLNHVQEQQHFVRKKDTRTTKEWSDILFIWCYHNNFKSTINLPSQIYLLNPNSNHYLPSSQIINGFPLPNHHVYTHLIML